MSIFCQALPLALVLGRREQMLQNGRRALAQRRGEVLQDEMRVGLAHVADVLVLDVGAQAEIESRV